MVFSSLLFLFRFLPIVLLAYYVAPRKLRNLVLFLMSLIFYAWGEPVYVVLMLFSTIVDYIHGRLIARCKERGNLRLARCFVISSVIINLGLLGFFKYSDFLIGMVNQGFGLALALPKLALPIGISFYTFQTMSYSIDVYRGEAPIQKNIIDFGAYVALFPQLIAGPIVRYKTIADQLKGRRESIDQFGYGIHRFLIGLGKKILLANNIGLIWSQISALPASELPMLTAWLGILAFGLQIYFDFSGYSDMAIGLGEMLGFHFLENFRHPYESRSITEFWRRWHISLGTWFREYVYIPLGGNRKGMAIQFRNIAIVWFLTGLWHGAAWNFILWGVYFGIILVAEKLFLLKWLEKAPSFLRRIYTLFLVCVSWAIFSYQDMAQPIGYMKAMFGLGKGGMFNQAFLYLLITNLILLAVGMIGSTSIPSRLVGKIKEKLVTRSELSYSLLETVFVGAIFIFCIAYLVNASYNPFLYFRF